MKPVKALFLCVGSMLCVGCEDARITLSVTDAPIDLAEEVLVQFDSVAFERDDGTREVVAFVTPRRVELSRLTGELSEALVTDEPLPASGYRAIEFSVQGTQATRESTVRLSDGRELSLYVPDAFSDDLRVPINFTIEEGESIALTVDFDLRRSLVIVDDDTAELRPALRVVRDEDAGSITGSIAANLLQLPCSPAVYAYEGLDAEPDDVGGRDDEPLSSAIVTIDTSSGASRYTIGFLEPGDYTLALTCDADIDEPDEDDELAFIRELEVEVRTSRREIANFQ